MRLLALDPGESTGWAIFQDAGIEDFGTLKKHEVEDWLIDQKPDVVVVEDYKIRPNKFNAHAWSSPYTLQLIGSIKTIFKMKGIQVILQQPSVKPVGYGLAGATYVKGKPNMHYLDAIAHGCFYLVTAKGVSPKCLHIHKES